MSVILRTRAPRQRPSQSPHWPLFIALIVLITSRRVEPGGEDSNYNCGVLITAEDYVGVYYILDLHWAFLGIIRAFIAVNNNFNYILFT